MRCLSLAIVFTCVVVSGVAQNTGPAASYYHFSLAKLHHLNQDYSDAVKEFEKALEADPKSVSLHTEFARSLVEMGEIARAVETCQKASELDPSATEPHQILGEIYYSYGRGDRAMKQKALAQFETVIELEPEHLNALRSLGELYADLGRDQDSADAWRKVREISPGSFGAYYFGAKALADAGNVSEAIEVLENGLRLRDDVPEYLLLLGGLYEQTGESGKAIELYQGALERLPKTHLRLTHETALTLMAAQRSAEAIPLLEQIHEVSSEADIDLARAYRAEKRVPEAVELLEGVLRRNPHDFEANFELGRSLVFLGEKDRARAKFEYLVKVQDPKAEPFRIYSMRHLAFIYEEEGRFDEAISLLEDVVRLRPGDLDSRLTLFYTYKEASRVEESMKLTEQLMEEHGTETYVLISRAQALASADRLEEGVTLLREQSSLTSEPEIVWVAASQLYFARDMFPEAELLVKEGLEDFPGSERLHFQLGAIYERQSDFGGAEEQFKKILAQNPDEADVLNYLGYMLVDRGVRLPEATEYIVRAVEIDPYNGAYLDSLGWAYFKQEDWERAEEYLQKAVRLNRSDPVICEHLGDLYTKMGNIEKAREYYELSISFQVKEEELERVKKKLADLNSSVAQ